MMGSDEVDPTARLGNPLLDDDEEVALRVRSSKSLSRSIGDAYDPRLGFWDVVATQSTWSTGAVVVMMPYIFGQLGYAVALVVLGVWQLLTYLVARFVCDVVLAADGRCTRLSDVGFELGGVVGRSLFRVCQYGNLLVYLPVAVETLAISLQAIFHHPWECIGWWKLIVVGYLFIILMLVKNWKETACFAYFSLAVLTVKAFVIIPYGLAYQQEDYKNSDMNQGPGQPVGNPEANWQGIFSCLISYTISSMFILVETMARTNVQEDYKKALGIANIFMYIFYAVPGLCSALMWGWNVDYIINASQLFSGTLGRILNLFIFIPVSLDFIIASLPVNDSIRRRFIDKENVPLRIGHGIWYHFKCIFPSLLFAFLFCTAIPQFEVLTSFVSAVTIVPIHTFVPSLVWWFGGKRKVFRSSIVLHIASVLIGLLVLSTGLTSTIYGLITTDYASASSFWCSST